MKRECTGFVGTSLHTSINYSCSRDNRELLHMGRGGVTVLRRPFSYLISNQTHSPQVLWSSLSLVSWFSIELCCFLFYHRLWTSKSLVFTLIPWVCRNWWDYVDQIAVRLLERESVDFVARRFHALMQGILLSKNPSRHLIQFFMVKSVKCSVILFVGAWLV